MQEYHDEGSCTERKERPVNHFDELGIRGIPNLVGRTEKVIKMIKEKSHGCLQLITQLLSIAGLAISISGHIWARHVRECLKEEGYPRSEGERQKEIAKAVKCKKRLFEKWKLKDYSKKKAEDSEYDLY